MVMSEKFNTIPELRKRINNIKYEIKNLQDELERRKYELDTFASKCQHEKRSFTSLYAGDKRFMAVMCECVDCHHVWIGDLLADRG